MVRLPKIAIGTNKRKAHFDLSHDDETSSDFGFCQPTVVRHVNAGSSSTIKTSIGVRLSPLPCPTFGRIKLKTFNTLVPMREVFEAFDYFIKGTSVASAFKTYIPKSAPSLPAFTLRDFILMQSLFDWSAMCDDSGDLKTDTDCDAFVNLTWLAPSLRSSNIRDTGVVVSDKKVYEFIDSTLVPIGSFYDGVSDVDALTSSLFTKVSAELFDVGANYRYRKASDLLGLDASIGFDTAFSGSAFDYNIPQACLDGSRDFRLNTIRRAFYANRPSSSAYDMCLTSELKQVSIDFTIGEDSCTINVPCGLFANWTKRGQRLFKVLNAIGIRGFMYNDDVDLPKFFAFYKAWFDNLNPGRNQQWRETSCFRLIHSYYDLNVDLYRLMFNQPENMPMTRAEVQLLFRQFLVDVSNCCYVLPVDNFTAATPDALMQTGSIEPISLLNSGTLDGITLLDTDGNTVSQYPHVVTSTGGATANDRLNRLDASMNGLVISSLLRLYKLANKNSVIGARIEDYLKTKYGYTIAQSHKLNGSEMNIKIEEIFANAGTSENRLGEIGGRGSNANANRGICKFEVDENSIFVQFVAIVPYGDYCQGNVRAKVTKNDFYQEVYDSLGKEKYAMSELMARCADLTYQPNPSSFGDVPVYWRDKVQNSMHNGAFALPSQRAMFLPYSLDRLFNETELRLKSTNVGGVKNITFERVAGTVLTPSEELRYIGRTPDYGNYDRIFYDNTGYYDNFILHIVQDWDYYATMKPISQSFDTFDDDNDESVTTITAS